MCNKPAPKTLASLHDLTPDPQNANRGTARGKAFLTSSLQQYGAARSIVTDKHGVVLAGTQTMPPATEIDLPITVVQTEGERLVVVQRLDLDLGTDDRARGLAIADNRASELGLDWDVEQLKAHLDQGF